MTWYKVLGGVTGAAGENGSKSGEDGAGLPTEGLEVINPGRRYSRTSRLDPEIYSLVCQGSSPHRAGLASIPAIHGIQGSSGPCKDVSMIVKKQYEAPRLALRRTINKFYET